MTDQLDMFVPLPPAPPEPPSGGPPNNGEPPPPLPEMLGDGDALPLGMYAERSYLEYAVSVVKGRALPHVCDGQKPVQRRILHTMNSMGLGPNTKPVKSARVVGDVIGKFHPHGDQAAYDAMVRLSQDFAMRYPLVDGQGNFGSRDGDGAAAMRYTEARLTQYAQLLLSEIDRGTVEFVANYDGSYTEPVLLPARLPMILLNGASGIAVGMATEIPSHNLREVAAAAVALIQNPQATTADLMQHIKGPDFPAGGQIISSEADILAAYETGRGPLKTRARWTFEELARGQWQMVVNQLPPAASAQKVLEEIEEITNPKIKAGKKSLTQEQNQEKQLLLSVLDAARDESDKDNPVRLVFEPRSSRIDRNEFVTTLLAYTSMESSVPINMVMIGRDGRPRQKSLREVLEEWVAFRFDTVRRRTEHRAGQVRDRIHVYEGRYIVYLNLDKVIKVVREADDPKAELMAKFNLSERQAEDILEMRVRQLNKLEGIKIEQELADLRKELGSLENLLTSERAMQRQVIKEIEADAKTYGDDRRTLIEATERAVLAVNVVDEPLTVIFSEKGWIRARSGHGLDLSSLSVKEGDRIASTVECRSVDNVVLFGSDGRVFAVPASQLPGGRGDGIPVTSLIEVQPKERVLHVLAGKPERQVLIATSSGYGFVCKLGDMFTRQKAGKQFITLERAELLLRPKPFEESPDALLAALSENARVHLFPLSEMKTLAGGGKGVIIMGLDYDEKMLDVTIIHDTLAISGVGRGQKPMLCLLRQPELQEFIGHRARKGRKVPAKMKPLEFVLPPAPEPPPPPA